MSFAALHLVQAGGRWQKPCLGVFKLLERWERRILEPLFRPRKNPEKPFTLQENFVRRIVSVARLAVFQAFYFPLMNEPFILKIKRPRSRMVICLM